MILSFSVDEFIQVAKEKYGYNAEQVLVDLFFNEIFQPFYIISFTIFVLLLRFFPVVLFPVVLL